MKQNKQGGIKVVYAMSVFLKIVDVGKLRTPHM